MLLYGTQQEDGTVVPVLAEALQFLGKADCEKNDRPIVKQFLKCLSLSLKTNGGNCVLRYTSVKYILPILCNIDYQYFPT